MFTITITETKLMPTVTSSGDITNEIYRQSFEALDIPKIVAVLNKRKRVRKERQKELPI